MKEKILSLILQLDIYGTHPRFTINGKKKFNTYFGSFMTLISFTIITLFFSLYALDVINHSNPKIITTIHNDAQPLLRKVTDKDFVISLSLEHSNYTNFIDERVYTVTAGVYKAHKKNGEYITERTPIEVIKCNQYNFEIVPEYFQSLDLENLYCLKNGTFIIEGEYQSESFQFIFFTFSKCDNSTSNNTCYSEDIINSVLSGGYIGIFMSDKVVIPNNFSIPYQAYGKNIFSSFSIKQFTDYWIYFKPIEVYTDSGLIFKSERKNSFVAFDRGDLVTDYRETNSFAAINLRESTKREIYERSYTKIQEAAANAGGIVKIVTLLSNAIVYFFRQILYRNFMIQFFKFNKNEFNNNQHKIGDTQSIIGNLQNRNHDLYFERINVKNNNLYQYQNNQNKISSVDSKPKFQFRKIINNTVCVNNYNHLNNNINNNTNNNINNNTNNNINNTNNNILNNSNNVNNISSYRYQNFSKRNFNNQIPHRHETSNLSVISGIQNLINNKKMENTIFTVKSSRNCFSIICRKGCINHIKYINYNYSKISFLFDIVQFFKTKFEVKLIKNKLFDEGERNKLNYLYKFNYDFDADKEGYDIFYKKKDPLINSSRSSKLKFKTNT